MCPNILFTPKFEKKKGSGIRRRSSSPPLVSFGFRVHDDRVLTLVFLDLLDIRHVLGDHFLVVFPLSRSSPTSGLSFWLYYVCS